MGGDRIINKINEEAKVQVSLAKEIGVTYQEIYAVWKEYALQRLNGKENILLEMKASGKYSQKALDYFTVIGIELFAMEYVKMYEETLNGK